MKRLDGVKSRAFECVKLSSAEHLILSVRVKKHLEKLARMEELYGDEEGIPDAFWAVHEGIKEGLKKIEVETIPPSFF